VPIRDNTPEGIAEITGNVLEFIPAEERHCEHPTVLRPHETQIGGEYFVVLSNWAGLFRYDLDDRVRVNDFHGDTPIIEFLSRGKHTANITGEKITEHQVVEAMQRASGNLQASIDRFVVQGRFGRTPYYELLLEAVDESQADSIARRMDEELGELNMEYRAKRTSGRLGAIKPIRLPNGTLDRAEDNNIRRIRGRSEQYKHQYLKTDVLSDPAESNEE
jgi:hypothetical protein